MTDGTFPEPVKDTDTLDSLAPAPPASPTPPGDSSPGRSFSQVVLGLVLLVIGAGWLLAVLDVDLPWRGILAAVVIVIGLALIVGARSGRHGGLIVIGVILTAFLALATTVEGVLDVPFDGGIGDKNVVVRAITELDSPYRLAIGELEVDLRQVDLPPGTTEVEASVVIGKLIVRFPADAVVRLEGDVGAGSLKFERQEDNGVGVDETIVEPGYDEATVKLLIRAAVGLGEVEVRR